MKLQTTPDRAYDLKLPQGLSSKLVAGIDDIPTWESNRRIASSRTGGSGSSVIRHKVRKGESLNGIARRYKTTPDAIVEANDLSSKKVKPGQVLKVPGRAFAKKAEKSKDKDKSAKSDDQGSDDSSDKIVKYKVKKGAIPWRPLQGVTA